MSALTCTESFLWASLTVTADEISPAGSVEQGISTCAFDNKTCYGLTTKTVADEDVDEAVFGPLLGGKWLVRMDPSCIVWLFCIFLIPGSAFAMKALQFQYQFISPINKTLTSNISSALGFSHLAKQLINDVHVCNVVHCCYLLAISVICIYASKNHCCVCWNINHNDLLGRRRHGRYNHRSARCFHEW